MPVLGQRQGRGVLGRGQVQKRRAGGRGEFKVRLVLADDDYDVILGRRPQLLDVLIALHLMSYLKR